jgi:hypothetical protein
VIETYSHKPSETGLPNEIFKRWTHAREEDGNEITVYRPVEFKFPPGHPRDGIEFRRDGTFIDWDIGPADGSSVPVNGRWQIEGPGRVRVSFEEGRQSRIRELVEYDSEVLKVRQQPASV